MNTSTDLDVRPTCHACGMYMEIRKPYGGSTPEQQFCGVWYDHPQTEQGSIKFGHTASVLLPSPELLAHLAALSESTVAA